MSDQSAPLRLASAAGRGALLATILASGMTFLDATIANVALPHLGAEFRATTAGLQWTVNSYALTLAAFVLLGGAYEVPAQLDAAFRSAMLWCAGLMVAGGLLAAVLIRRPARPRPADAPLPDSATPVVRRGRPG